MPRSVRVHQLVDLANEECNNEIFLQTTINTELYIIKHELTTVIKLPFGNKFDIIDGVIIIHNS